MVGRNGDGKSTLMRLLADALHPGLRPGDQAQRGQHRLPGPERRARRRPHGRRRDRRRPGRLRMGPQPPDPRSHGRPRVRRRLARQRPCALRRAEAARGAGQAADRGPRRHHARRAHQPPRRRRRRVAVPAPEDPLAGQPGRLPRGHPRPLVPRRSLQQDLGNPRRHHGPVRRRLRRLRAGPRRTRPLRVRDGKQAPAAREEGTRVAAPRRPGPHRQAQVPDRGGQRPDRRRPRAARLDGAEQDGHRPARQGRPGPRERLPGLPRRRRRAEALRQHHPAACPG